MGVSQVTYVVGQDIGDLAAKVQAKIDLNAGWVPDGSHFKEEDGPYTQCMVIGNLQTVDGALAFLGGVTATAAELNQYCDESARNEVVTATNVILASESGKTFFLSSATEFVSTLPAPALGLQFTFIVTAAPSGASYTITTNSGANIIKGLQLSAAGDAGDTGTADDTITFVDGQAVAGDRVDVISDGTYWYAYARSKLAAGVTFTTSS